MVIFMGFRAFNGKIGFYNSKSQESIYFDRNGLDPKNAETIDQFFEYIKENITKEFIDYLCVILNYEHRNEFRKKFLEVSRINNVKNVRIISKYQAHLIGAIKGLAVNTKNGDEIWIFVIYKNTISNCIWKFDADNGWKFQNIMWQERKHPVVEDLIKLKSRMKIGAVIPYIYVLHEGISLGKEQFKRCFLKFQNIKFNAGGVENEEWSLIYARFLSGEKSFSRFKSNCLIESSITITNSDGTIICRIKNFQNLPHFQSMPLHIKKDDLLKIYEFNALSSCITVKENDVDYEFTLNIDINGIFIIKLQPLYSIFETINQFSIPKKLQNFNSDFNAIGIDLGTTECCAAVIRKNGADFVVLDIIRNSRAMPSYIAFDEAMPKCGQIVVDRMRHKADFSVYDTKRIIGRPYDEIIIDPLWPFTVINKSDDDVQIEVKTTNGKVMKSCETLTEELLRHIKTTLETYQGKLLNEVVITIPSEFSNQQKWATLKAARMSGFQKVHFLPEVIAAAFAYFNETEIPVNSNILICDCGGGTFDVFIAEITPTHELKVLNFDGDSYLGGRDFDKILFNHFSAILNHQFGIDVMKTSKKYVLRQKCQNIKHTLSAALEDWIDVSDFDIENDSMITVTREEFERMADDLILRMKNVISRSIKNAKLQKFQIQHIFQVGGGCRMPMIKGMLKEEFPNAKHKCHLYPDWAVAHGAALYSYYLKTLEKPAEKLNPKSLFSRVPFPFPYL